MIKPLSCLIFEDQKPSVWDEMFFINATIWSRKSHDTETQCGCVLVKDKRIVAPLDTTAYITAAPCINCLQMLYQAGVSEIAFTNISNPKMQIFSKGYTDLLKLIGDNMKMRFIDKRHIDTSILEKSIKYIKSS